MPGFGGSALFAVTVLLYAPTRWWFRASGMVLVGMLVGSGVMLAAALLSRRRFRRASRPTPWRLAIWALVFVVSAMIAFVMLFNDE